MGKRTEWTFRFTAAHVLEAAEKRQAHHVARGKHWAERVEVAKTELKTDGIDWRDAVMRQSDSVRTSTAYVAQPVFDSTKLQALNEAQERVQHHQKHADNYAVWVNVLRTSARDRELELDFDDIVFFGLDGTKAESAE
jgi:hypothetical protein